jgi:hypothetical protein
MAVDPTIPFWPRALGPKSVQPYIANSAASGPQPLAGAPQTAQSSLGRLELRLNNVTIHDGAPITAYGNYDKLRAFRALYFGRLAHGLPVYMPMWDWVRGPRRRAGLPLFGAAVPHDDGTPFSDGTQYQQGTGDALLAIVAAAGDRVIVIDAISAAVPQAGDWITLGERAHQVTGAWPDDTGNFPDRWTLALDRSLRSACAAGEEIEVADPFCIMTLAAADRRVGAEVDFNRMGRLSLTFIEANWAP